MAYTIVNSYIPTSLYPLKASYPMIPEYITIHNTYNDATAVNEIAYMTRNATVVGYHVAIDDKQAIQAIPFIRNAFHAGDGQGYGNRKSIGIEICYSKSGGPKYVAAEENAVGYVAQLLKQYGWGIDRVKWHRDWSGKKCPHRIIDEGRTQSVKDRITKRLEELKLPTPPKEDVRMFKPSSPTLQKAFVDKIEATTKSKILNDGKWLTQAKAGTLSLDDALALSVYIDSK